MTDALDTALGQSLPHNPDAERAVLGSILLSSGVMWRLATLTDEDFFKEANRQIFAVMAFLESERGPIDTLTVKNELAHRGELEAVGGAHYVASLTDMVPDIANVERYAAIVQELAARRRLITFGNKIMQDALSGGTAADVAASAISQLGAHATKESEQARSLSDVVADAFEYQQAHAKKGQSVSFTTGWPTLDDYQVIYPTLVLITADKGVGKSALMVSLSRSLAIHGHGNVMFSLESIPREIGLRYATIETQIPHRLMRDWRQFGDDHRERAREAQRAAGQLNVWVDRGPWAVEGIEREIRRLRALKGVQVAFVDYMQLVESAGRFEREELRLAYAAQRLLRLANELEMSIILYSQVNEAGEVAYAKSAEKAARVRIHFERPEKDEHDERAHHAVFYIRKHNEGRTCAKGFDAHFDEPYITWREGTCASGACGKNKPPETASLFGAGG